MFKRYWWMLLVMAPVGMIAGLLIASVVTYVMPKKYESFATIEVKPRRSLIAPLDDVSGSGAGEMTPQFIGTEFEKIKSRNSLSKVIDSLDLTSRWDTDRDSALRILKGIVETQEIRGTDLISITVRHTNREDARDITAEVARAYKEYRSELESKTLNKGLNQLKKAVRDQEDKVEERRKKLRSGAGPFLLDGSNLPETKDSDAGDFAGAKRNFETDQALLEQMKLKLVAAEIERDIEPDDIVIHDDPVIADSPVSPNVTLNLVLGAVGGLLISPFLALLLMWWMHRRNPVQG